MSWKLFWKLQKWTLEWGMRLRIVGIIGLFMVLRMLLSCIGGLIMRRRGQAAVQSSFLPRSCVSCLVVMLDILSVSIGMIVLLHDVFYKIIPYIVSGLRQEICYAIKESTWWFTVNNIIVFLPIIIALYNFKIVLLRLWGEEGGVRCVGCWMLAILRWYVIFNIPTANMWFAF